MNTTWPRALALAVCLIGAGCGGFRTAGRNVVGGALDELDRRGGTDALTRQAVVGARDELTSAETRRRLQEMQREMLEELHLEAARIRKELLGEELRREVELLRSDLMTKTQRDIERMRDSLLGARTEARADVLAERFAGDATRLRIAAMRDELLGDTSRDMVRLLVEHAGGSVQHQVDLVRLRLETEKQDLQDRLSRTLWISGSVVAGLMVFAAVVFDRKRRFERMVSVIAEQIREIPDRADYNALTERISASARVLGLERPVRDYIVRPGSGDPKEGGK